MDQISLSPIHYCAKHYPKQIAIKNNDLQINYQELSDHVIRLNHQFYTLGLKKGDRIGVISRNNVEMILLYWTCVDLGLLFCPISVRFPTQQISDLLDRYQINYYWSPQKLINIVNSQYIDLDNCGSSIILDPFNSQTYPQININDPIDIILTSGSSGSPKAAVHHLHNHIISAKGSNQFIALDKNDHWLLSLPLFHIGGLAILNRCALVGACVVMKNDDMPLGTQLIQDKITHLSLVSTQLQRLLNENPQSLKHIKALLLGGGTINQSLLSQLKKLNISAYTSYGMTEMSSQITTGYASDDGNCGKPLQNREIDIRNGIIWVKGAVLFQGYLQEDGSTLLTKDPQGWFCTQDCGYWDKNNNLHITGRNDNMFICGGENIHPEEIEQAIKLHPQVEDAVVFAISDNEFSLLPAAIVKTKNDILENIEQVKLNNFLIQNIAQFKRPRQYFPWPNISQDTLKINRKLIIATIKDKFNLN